MYILYIEGVGSYQWFLSVAGYYDTGRVFVVFPAMIFIGFDFHTYAYPLWEVFSKSHSHGDGLCEDVS